MDDAHIPKRERDLRFTGVHGMGATPGREVWTSGGVSDTDRGDAAVDWLVTEGRINPSDVPACACELGHFRV